MNRLLSRQLRRYNIDLDEVPENFKNLILSIDKSYQHSEKERQLIEHTMDISSQELSEANRSLRKRKQELERYNQELKRLSYITAHDLKEPLRTIGSFVRLVERREPNLTDESKEFIQLAIDGAVRMRELLDDLMRYTLIDSPVNKNNEELDLNQIIHNVILNLNTKIEENDAHILFEDLPIVKGEKTQLILLLQNLIDNSMKFRKEAIPEIKIIADSNYKTGYTKISVIDNGIGIEPVYKEKVFDVFQRLNRTESYQGTGIGLAICKKIVEKCTGEIWVDHTYTEGLKLEFTLPVSSNGSLSKAKASEGKLEYK